MSGFKLESNIGQITRQLHSRSEKLVAETALGIEADIKTHMAEPKSGMTYGAHQASAPGERGLANDTGNYSNSIQTVIEGASATVGTNAEQAAVGEFGGVEMAARPAWQPAFDEAKPEFERKLKEIFE